MNAVLQPNAQVRPILVVEDIAAVPATDRRTAT